MNADLITPFIHATVNVLKTMGGTDPKPGAPSVKKGNRTWGVITGIIGMAGSDVTGSLVISFDEPSILKIVSNMLMDDFKEINHDVVDAVGEITNMISGGTKSALSEKGYNFNMATPMMMTGKDIELAQLSKSPVISVPFTTDAGKFVVETHISKKAAS